MFLVLRYWHKVCGSWYLKFYFTGKSKVNLPLFSEKKTQAETLESCGDWSEIGCHGGVRSSAVNIESVTHGALPWTVDCSRNLWFCGCEHVACLIRNRMSLRRYCNVFKLESAWLLEKTYDLLIVNLLSDSYLLGNRPGAAASFLILELHHAWFEER